ncbi:MAG TPA: HEAT repeat domain-containing protein [Kofleriaceae bacterium]|nr:HEAT repeat domain-containing protein [Kofleriaceae bacterium]
MKNIGIKLAAVAFLVCAGTPAFAGKGGSAAQLQSAIASRSTDAIIAEVERIESLACTPCVQMVTDLTADARYPVREVAAWWFAKRPALAKQLATKFKLDLASGTSIQVRNAADFLGASSTFDALPALRAAIRRDVDADAKLAIVRAVDLLGNLGGNEVLTVAMTDRDASVRAAAVKAWRDIRGQVDAAPVVPLLADPDALVRAEAATVVGGMKQTAAVGALEGIVVNDPSPVVRRNAAWALGKLGLSSSRDALARATLDTSGLVRMTAKAALATIR